MAVFEAEAETEAEGKGNLLQDDRTSKSTFSALSSPKLTRKARKNEKKRRKSLLQSQNVENREDNNSSSRERNLEVERELLGVLYGYQSSTEHLVVPEAADGSAAETYPWLCTCGGEKEISHDESDSCIESDLENIFNKYATQLDSWEGSTGRIKRKWKNDKSERIKRFCEKLEHLSQLSCERRKNAKRAPFVACKREIHKNEQKNENVKNRKENIERKLREKNIVRRCPDWVPKHEDCQVEKKNASKSENYKNKKPEHSKRKERQMKKLRKHILFSTNAMKGLLWGGSAKRLIELQKREIYPDDFDILIQLDFAEIRRRNSKYRKKNTDHSSTADIKLTSNPVKYKNKNNTLKNKNQADVKKISKYILQPGNASKPAASADDFLNKLMELQDREITPEDFDLLLQLDSTVAPKTVNKSVVDSLRTDKYQIENNDIEQCTICMEDYEDGCVCKYLPCGHVFHSNCIRTWLTTTSTKCPIDNLEV